MDPQILIAIAQLCIASGSSKNTYETSQEAFNRQKGCQVHYIQCLREHKKKNVRHLSADALANCILGE